MSLPITVLILTKNEEAAISDCIASTHDFGEVLIIDSKSSDKTKEIAEKVGLGVCGKWMSANKLDEFTDEIIQECINAIDSVKGVGYTTYDKDVIMTTKAQAIAEIQKRFK